MLAIIKDRRPLALCHVDELQFVLPEPLHSTADLSPCSFTHKFRPKSSQRGEHGQLLRYEGSQSTLPRTLKIA